MSIIVANSFIQYLTSLPLFVSTYKNYVYQTKYLHCVDQYTHVQCNLFIPYTYEHFCNYAVNYNNVFLLFEQYFKYIKCLQKHNILLDFFGVNFGKLIHFGHVRGLLIGIMLNSIFSALNQNVISDTHYGDYGLNMALFLNYFKQNDIHNIDICDIHNIYVTNRTQISNNITDVLLQLHEYREHYNYIRDVSIAYIHCVTKFFKFQHTMELSEYSYYDLCKYLEQYMLRNSYASYDELNKLISSNGIVLARSNGVYIYAFTDIAAIFEREKLYNVSHIFYIVDDRQRDHFKLIFEFCDLLHFTAYKEHVRYGEVRNNDGELYKTREHGHNYLNVNIMSYIKFLKEKFNIDDDRIIIISFMLYEIRHNTYSPYTLYNSVLYDYIVKIHNFIKVIENIQAVECNDYFDEEKVLIDNFVRLCESIVTVANTRNLHYVYTHVFNIIHIMIKMKVFSIQFKKLFDTHLVLILRIIFPCL